jgi:hypothetical protein
MPSLRSAFSRVLVAWSIRKRLRSAHLTAISAAIHSPVRSPCMSMNATASQRSMITAARDANVSHQLPREPSIVPYLVHVCHAVL